MKKMHVREKSLSCIKERSFIFVIDAGRNNIRIKEADGSGATMSLLYFPIFFFFFFTFGVGRVLIETGKRENPQEKKERLIRANPLRYQKGQDPNSKKSINENPNTRNEQN